MPGPVKKEVNSVLLCTVALKSHSQCRKKTFQRKEGCSVDNKCARGVRAFALQGQTAALTTLDGGVRRGNMRAGWPSRAPHTLGHVCSCT